MITKKSLMYFIAVCFLGVCIIISSFAEGDCSYKIEKDYLSDEVTSGLVPVGTVIPFAGSTAPDGWLICNGAALDNTSGQYDSLFAVIGTVYGGTGQTSFNLPNMSGRAAVGVGTADSKIWALADTYGEDTHTLTVDEMPNHTHRESARANPDFSYSYGTEVDVSENECYSRSIVGTTTSHALVSNRGGDQAHNNIQPSIALTYIIKY